MIRRQIVMPVSPERLWDALTEPGQLAKWFGADVEWELREGGSARFRRDDGTERAGRVEAVRPGRHLRFRWWPAEPPASDPAAGWGPEHDPRRPGRRRRVRGLVPARADRRGDPHPVDRAGAPDRRQPPGRRPTPRPGAARVASAGEPAKRSTGHGVVGLGRPLVRRLGRVQRRRRDGQARCPRLKARR